MKEENSAKQYHENIYRIVKENKMKEKYIIFYFLKQSFVIVKFPKDSLQKYIPFVVCYLT